VIDALLRYMLPGRKAPGGQDERFLAFARGLALGALVGAAIAGSGIWRRWRTRI
jgi:hypothetical protein